MTFQLSAVAALGCLILPALIAPAAFAQPAAPPVAADPPARVGVLSRIVGTVSSHDAEATQWSAATLNGPVTSGDAFWTEPQAEADIDIGPLRLTLAPETEFDIATLDNRTLAATQVRGEVYAHLRAASPGERTAITTPRATVTLIGTGRTDIVAGDETHPTVVTVLDGAAELTGANLSLRVGAHQAATISGTDSFVATVAAAGEDAFLREQLARERPVVVTPTPQAVPPPPVITQMTGGDALAGAGQWSNTPEYGAVWYPPVAADWAPFRHGRWIWVSPWGWTWVDDAAWGFPTSHYGRWIDLAGRWAWTPVPLAPAGQPVAPTAPVYAPAMVTFTRLTAGAAAGASIGWAPLGPREPYLPPYQASNRYLAKVNAINVAHVGAVAALLTNPPAFDSLANQRAATVVPVTAMTESLPIASRAESAPPREMAAARALATAPLAPTLQTAGVTPSVARQFNLGTPPGGLAVAPAAPGPDLRPRDPQFGRGPLHAQPAAVPNSADLLHPERPVPGGPVAPLAPAPFAPAPLAPMSGRPVEPALARPTTPRPSAATAPVRPALPQVARPEAPLPQVIEPTPQAAEARPAAPSPEPSSRQEPRFAAEPRPVAPPSGVERAEPAPTRAAPPRPGLSQRPGDR